MGQFGKIWCRSQQPGHPQKLTQAGFLYFLAPGALLAPVCIENNPETSNPTKELRFTSFFMLVKNSQTELVGHLRYGKLRWPIGDIPKFTLF